MRIPRAHDLTLEYCALFGLQLRPFVMGNPEGPRLPRRRADDRRPRPTRSPSAPALRAGRARARPDRRRSSGTRRPATSASGSSAGPGGLGRDRPRVRPVLAARVPREKAASRTRAPSRLYGVMNFRRSRHEQGRRREAARDHRARRTSTCRRSSAAWIGCRTPSTRDSRTRPVRRRGLRASTRTPDSVTVHYKTESGRSPVTGDYAICTLPFSVLRDDRDLASRSHARSSGRSASSTTTPRPRSCSRSGTGSGRRRTASSAARPSPICRSAASTTRPRSRRPSAASCWRATRGARTRRAGARMDEETRIEQALEDVAQIHPRIAEEFEVGASHAWYDDPWARGAFALFAPEQQTAAAGRHRRSRRAGSTSPASTARCTTPGSRARSSRAFGPRARSTRTRGSWSRFGSREGGRSALRPPRSGRSRWARGAPPDRQIAVGPRCPARHSQPSMCGMFAGIYAAQTSARTDPGTQVESS